MHNERYVPNVQAQNDILSSSNSILTALSSVKSQTTGNSTPSLRYMHNFPYLQSIDSIVGRSNGR